MTHNKTILLISNELNRFENMALLLRQIGYYVLFARDGREGFRLTRRESPDLVISELNLTVISALDLCRMIRTDRELWATPLMFVAEPGQDSKKLVEILEAGADECLAEFSDPQYLAAKAAWLIKRKFSENYLIQNYEIQRSRQLQITEIIKETSNLFSKSGIEYKTAARTESINQALENKLSQRIELGMNMISALTNLLDEQMNALEIWGRSRRGDELIIEQETESNIPELNYEYVTYSLLEDNLSAH